MIKFTGNALPVAQVETITIGGTWVAGEIITCTVTGLDGSTAAITFTLIAGATATTDVVTGLVTAWNASTNILCTPITAIANASILTLTADIEGIRFIVITDTDSVAGTVVQVRTIENISIHHWANPNNWLGVATPIAQIDTFTVAGTILATETFTLTLTADDGTTQVITATGETTVTGITAGLTLAWNTSIDARLTVITATDSDPDVVLTADIDGFRFTVAGTTDSAGGTIARVATQVNVGLPGSAISEDVTIEDAIIYYGLDQSDAANALATLTIRRSQIGVDPSEGIAIVPLDIDLIVCDIDNYVGPKTSIPLTPINLKSGTSATRITIWDAITAAASTALTNSVRLLPTVGTTDIHIKKGKIGIAAEDGETATCGDIYISDTSSSNNLTDVVIGSGVTMSDLIKTGGDCWLNCTATTIRNDAGYLYSAGTGTITIITSSGGYFILNALGLIGTIEALGGVVDETQSIEARSITNVKIAGGVTYKRNPAAVTHVNQIAPYNTNQNIQLVVTTI